MNQGSFEQNEVLARLPAHLLDLVIDQPYNEYTAQDHAVWRYVMRQNVRYLPQVAHGSYLEGLRRTGISIDRIPHMYGMNRILKEIGWAAVAVDGFIPPAAFMEFQAFHVLVIAADIRPIDQIGYTPAPDILHEAAGHAPIIADEEYAEYLRMFGEVGARAFSSSQDHALYEAIRLLSILKANPYTPKDRIRQAEEKIAAIEASMSGLSEMARLRNLHWWTVEYGLIGSLEKPKIYGAGLLSSIRESYECLRPEVKKLPYGPEAALVNFDITNQQPQLFVTPDFASLKTVLDAFASSLAIHTGGAEGVRKAVESAHTATCVYRSGLQLTGTFGEPEWLDGIPVYLRTDGPSALSYGDRELGGHGRAGHADGFGSPVGRWVGQDIPPEQLDDRALESMAIRRGHPAEILFESGVRVRGKLEEITRREDKLLLLSFSQCTVEYRGRVLFEPGWGRYDMAVGSEIVSAFSGPADPGAFGWSFPPSPSHTLKIHHGPRERQLHGLYGKVRAEREGGQDPVVLLSVWQSLKNEFPADWLLPLEILEGMNGKKGYIWVNEIRRHLEALAGRDASLASQIENGLSIIND